MFFVIIIITAIIIIIVIIIIIIVIFTVVIVIIIIIIIIIVVVENYPQFSFPSCAVLNSYVFFGFMFLVFLSTLITKDSFE